MNIYPKQFRNHYRLFVAMIKKIKENPDSYFFYYRYQSLFSDYEFVSLGFYVNDEVLIGFHYNVDTLELLYGCISDYMGFYDLKLVKDEWHSALPEDFISGMIDVSETKISKKFR